jgi:hypothetical protein
MPKIESAITRADDRRVHRPSQRDEQVCSPCRRDAFAGCGRGGVANRGVHGRGERAERDGRVPGGRKAS